LALHPYLCSLGFPSTLLVTGLGVRGTRGSRGSAAEMRLLSFVSFALKRPISAFLSCTSEWLQPSSLGKQQKSQPSPPMALSRAGGQQVEGQELGNSTGQRGEEAKVGSSGWKGVTGCPERKG